MDNEVFEWEVKDGPVSRKPTDWYWAVGIIALAGAVAAILFNNLLFAGVIIIGAFVLALSTQRPQKNISIRIDKKGIIVGQRRYPFKALNSFWIEEAEEDEAESRLLIDPESMFAPNLTLPLPADTDTETLAAFLREYIPEEEQEEPLLDRLTDLIGL